MDWLIYGNGEMYGDISENSIENKIRLLLEGLSEEQQRELLKSLKKEKLLIQLLAKEEHGVTSSAS